MTRLLILFPQRCSWIPVDSIGGAIVEIALAESQAPPPLVYNLCSPSTFSWTKDLLPALAAGGLPFRIVPFTEWIEMLQLYHDTHSTEEAVQNCPAVKLIDYWKRTYGGKTQTHTMLSFATDNAQQKSSSMRDAPDIIETGMVKQMLSAWLAGWVPTIVPIGTGHHN